MFAWTAMPVYRATILLVRMICFVSTVQCTCLGLDFGLGVGVWVGLP